MRVTVAFQILPQGPECAYLIAGGRLPASGDRTFPLPIVSSTQRIMRNSWLVCAS
jgi:hypothetical protein